MLLSSVRSSCKPSIIFGNRVDTLVRQIHTQGIRGRMKEVGGEMTMNINASIKHTCLKKKVAVLTGTGDHKDQEKSKENYCLKEHTYTVRSCEKKGHRDEKTS